MLRCVDSQCRFAGRKGLPVHVVDEDIYDVRPSIVIGTVDKFAMMAWQPEARRCSGSATTAAAKCRRRADHPGRAAPDLRAARLDGRPVRAGHRRPLHRPRASGRSAEDHCSTATIRRYEDQIQGLFGRERGSALPAARAGGGRSFFAEPATLDGRRARARTPLPRHHERRRSVRSRPSRSASPPPRCKARSASPRMIATATGPT